MLSITDTLLRALERVLGLVLIAAIALNFFNVVGRYLFGFVVLSADELEVFALVAITFLGAAIVAWRGQNLRMDVLRTALPASWQRAIDVLEAALSLVIAGFMVFVSYQYVRKVVLLGQVSDMAELPMWIPHGFVLVGFLLIAATQVLRAFAAIWPGASRQSAPNGPASITATGAEHTS
jgi:TRAP-type C4-dicarboxylate transport system permease small subunit